MRLSDDALSRLRESVRTPDFSGTRYRLVGPVGAGGMGAVFEAMDEPLGRVLAGLEHPGLVPVHDAGRLADGRAYYAMKLVRGRRLDEALAGSSLPERLRVFLRVCEPVAFAHASGVVHRDLKPSNVMLGAFGEVLVLDWGLARPVAGAADASGTPGFMAPEQAAGGSVDARADVYGLGALLDAILRVPPAPARPKALLAIVAVAMAPEPGARYPDVPALAADVERLLDGGRVEAYEENVLERAARFVKRHGVAVGLVATYLLVRGLFILLRR